MAGRAQPIFSNCPLTCACRLGWNETNVFFLRAYWGMLLPLLIRRLVLWRAHSGKIDRLVARVERVIIVVLHLIVSILLAVKRVWRKRGWLGLLLVVRDAIQIPNAGFSRSMDGETTGPTERRIMCRRWLRLLEMTELYADMLEPLDLSAGIVESSEIVGVWRPNRRRTWERNIPYRKAKFGKL